MHPNSKKIRYLTLCCKSELGKIVVLQHMPKYYFFFLWRCGPTRSMASSFLRFLNYTQRRITVGRTPLGEWSARLGDLYLTTHNIQTSMPPVGFEPTISVGERPQTYALDRAATATGPKHYYQVKFGAGSELPHQTITVLKSTSDFHIGYTN